MIGKVFKKTTFFILIAVCAIAVVFIMLKYNVEGEKNLPFSISKILIVSTVDGQVNDDPDNIWNIGIKQVNDIYIYLDKLAENDQTIKEIKLENFNLTTNPEKGQVKLLRPTGDLPNLYTYSEEDHFDKGIVFIGSRIDDMKSLEISNDGGVLGFRLSLEDLGTFISNEKEEISYDGSLLSDLGLNTEQISFSISFDIIITTSENVNFKGTINLDLPLEDIIEKGTSSKEILDFNDVIFKRV